MGKIILPEHKLLLGYSKSLERELSIIVTVEGCWFSDCEPGVELLVRAEHKPSWWSYKLNDMVAVKAQLVKTVAEMKRNYNVIDGVINGNKK